MITKITPYTESVPFIISKIMIHISNNFQRRPPALLDYQNPTYGSLGELPTILEGNESEF